MKGGVDLDGLTLYQLNQNIMGKVIGFNGGYGLIRRLDNLGVRKGKKIIKRSDSFIGGPVTIQIDNIKIAIGCRMAEKIIVEVDE